jgi:hypothetical protein
LRRPAADGFISAWSSSNRQPLNRSSVTVAMHGDQKLDGDGIGNAETARQ